MSDHRMIPYSNTIWIPDYHWNTRHLNPEQVKVCNSVVSLILRRWLIRCITWFEPLGADPVNVLAAATSGCRFSKFEPDLEAFEPDLEAFELCSFFEEEEMCLVMGGKSEKLEVGFRSNVEDGFLFQTLDVDEWLDSGVILIVDLVVLCKGWFLRKVIKLH